MFCHLQLVAPCANSECGTTPTGVFHSKLLQSTSVDTFIYGRESTSFIRVGVLSDSAVTESSQTSVRSCTGIVPFATVATPYCDEKSLRTTFQASYAPGSLRSQSSTSARSLPRRILLQCYDYNVQQLRNTIYPGSSSFLLLNHRRIATNLDIWMTSICFAPARDGYLAVRIS